MKWISVKEKPKNHINVLCYHKDRGYWIDMYDDIFGWCQTDLSLSMGLRINYPCPTHWMPLPEAPSDND